MLNYSKVLATIAVLFIAFHAKAQPPVMLVNNTTSCTLEISIVEGDNNCNYGTNPVVTLPPGITPIFGTAPYTKWSFCKIYTMCAPLDFNLNLLYLSNSCAPHPRSDYMYLTAPCSACQPELKAAFTSESSILIW